MTSPLDPARDQATLEEQIGRCLELQKPRLGAIRDHLLEAKRLSNQDTHESRRRWTSLDGIKADFGHVTLSDGGHSLRDAKEWTPHGVLEELRAAKRLAQEFLRDMNRLTNLADTLTAPYVAPLPPPDLSVEEREEE